MRYAALAVLAAIGAQAAPQESVQPISQISDGQIQAPPATSVVVAPSSGPVVVPSVTDSVPVVVPTSGVVAPTSGVVVPTSAVVLPTSGVVAPSSAVPSSGTGLPSGTGSNVTVSTGAPTSGPSSNPTNTPPPNNGAAAVGISLSGLALAVAAFVFA